MGFKYFFKKEFSLKSWKCAVEEKRRKTCAFLHEKPIEFLELQRQKEKQMSRWENLGNFLSVFQVMQKKLICKCFKTQFVCNFNVIAKVHWVEELEVKNCLTSQSKNS